MPASRILKYCVALSVLFHVAIALLASLIPVAQRASEDVMVVDLADLPRATDFLPPKPGIVEGARPKPPPVRARPAPKEELPRPSRDVMNRLLHDLPVDADLPPRKEYPERTELQPQRPKEPPAETARAADREQEAKPAAPAGGARDAAKGGTAKSLRDLTPGLGKTVLAMADRASGRGKGKSGGTATGTEAKAREKGEIAEESGTSARLKPLTDRDVQFLSYVDSIRFKIYLVWNYPYEAAAAGVQGQVVVDFVIGPGGELESCNLVRSSGNKILDAEAVRAVQAAAPYNPLPEEYMKKYGTTKYPVQGFFRYEIFPVSFR